MPVMDGIETCIQIQERINNNLMKKIPIIMVSAFNGQDNIDYYTQIGCSNFIEKPINEIKVFEIIESLIINKLQ